MSKYIRSNSKCKYESYSKEEIDNQLINFKLKNDFDVLTFNLGTGNMSFFSYPEGFNKNNIVIISIVVENEISSIINDISISFYDSGIQIANLNNNYPRSGKVFIMKIS